MGVTQTQIVGTFIMPADVWILSSDASRVRLLYKNGKDWVIKYDNEGITIEDALLMIELSRKKKDKHVFGAMGAYKKIE